MKNVNPLRTEDVSLPLAQALLSWKVFQQALRGAAAAKAKVTPMRIQRKWVMTMGHLLSFFLSWGRKGTFT